MYACAMYVCMRKVLRRMNLVGICIIAIVILLIGSLWIEYPIGAQSFSIHTRIKAQIWNIAIALFSICLLIIDDHKMKL